MHVIRTNSNYLKLLIHVLLCNYFIKKKCNLYYSNKANMHCFLFPAYIWTHNICLAVTFSYSSI